MATPPVPTANISDGQLVQNTDLDGYGDASNGFPGTLGNMIAGVSSVNSNVSPLTIVPGTGFNVVIGGTGQWFMLQGQIVDYLPGLTETLAGSSSLDRYDLICAQYAKVNGEPYTTSFLSITNVLTNGVTVYETLRGAAWQVVQGTPGAGQTAATPNGWVAIAWVKVPGSSSSLVQADITMIIPTWASVIQGYAASTPTTINGVSGAITISSPDGSISVSGTQNIHLEVTNPGITVIESSDNSVLVNAVAGGYNLRTASGGTQPVGATVTVVSSNASVGTTFTLTLPTLVSGAWNVIFDLFTSVGGAGSYLVLTGSGATWQNSPSTVSGASSSGYTFQRPLLIGTATGGQAPSVTVSFGGSSLGTGNAIQALITATRIT